MIDLSTTIFHGLLICIPFSIFAVGSFWRWPRLWLHSLPADIQRMAGPKTKSEIRYTRYLMVTYLLVFPVLPCVSALYAANQVGVDLSFWGAVAHTYGIWIVIHTWDFVIIDCGHALLIDPDRPPIAGTEGAKGYRNYGFHIRSLVKAIVMSAVMVVPLSAIMAVIA